MTRAYVRCVLSSVCVFVVLCIKGRAGTRRPNREGSGVDGRECGSVQRPGGRPRPRPLLRAHAVPRHGEVPERKRVRAWVRACVGGWVFACLLHGRTELSPQPTTNQSFHQHSGCIHVQRRTTHARQVLQHQPAGLTKPSFLPSIFPSFIHSFHFVSFSLPHSLTHSLDTPNTSPSTAVSPTRTRTKRTRTTTSRSAPPISRARSTVSRSSSSRRSSPRRPPTASLTPSTPRTPITCRLVDNFVVVVVDGDHIDDVVAVARRMYQSKLSSRRQFVAGLWLGHSRHSSRVRTCMRACAVNRRFRAEEARP